MRQPERADETPVRLLVELQRGPGPINGSIRPDGGDTSRFVGWLGLMSAVERLRSPARDDRMHE